MPNIADMWPLVAASAGVVFCAGQLVEKVRNGKYVNKDMCQEVQKGTDYRLGTLDKNLSKLGEDLKRIESKIDKLKGGV